MYFLKETFYSRHLEEIRSGGIMVLMRKIRKLPRAFLNLLYLLLHGGWAIPYVLLMRTLRPFILIRMFLIDCTRIGHMGFQIPYFYALLKKKPLKTMDIFSLSEKNCNLQMTKMGRRVLPIYSWVKYIYRWNKILPGNGSLHEHHLPVTWEDKEGIFTKDDTNIPFLEEETKIAKDWLSKQGWTEGEPFVCLLVRDSAFLANDLLHGKGDKASYERWSYHDFRDADITTYYPAMKWLADQGVWVLRMGKIMANEISVMHPRIIDYAFHPDKSDLLDIWLFANCAGCISSGNGIDIISKVYCRPVVTINYVPIDNCLFSYNLMCVPKYQRWSDSHRHFTIKEIILGGIPINDTNKIIELGVELIDLSPDEILEAVKEFWGRIEGSWAESKEDAMLQKRFLENYLNYIKISPQAVDHGFVNPKFRFGTAWLRLQNKDFFE